jgi:hypothetical protein
LGAAISARPNLKLAAAFGTEVAELSGVTGLLDRLSADDAAPDTDRVFLPIAAAHGWAARIRAGRDVARGWGALALLAADERAVVRVGTLDALMTLSRIDGGGVALVERAAHWLSDRDREVRFGTGAIVADVLADPRVFAGVKDVDVLLGYLDQLVAEIAAAPRSAERSEGRRRLLLALPGVLALVARGSTAGRNWFEATCESATHTDVRKVLSDTIVKMGTGAQGGSKAGAEGMRKVLEESAKPLRDPTRLRAGTGRGKASRRTR